MTLRRWLWRWRARVPKPLRPTAFALLWRLGCIPPIAGGLGGGGGSRTNYISSADIPKEYRPLIDAGVRTLIPTVEGTNLAAFQKPFVQTISDLTPAEKNIIDAYYNVALDPTSPYQTEGIGTYERLLQEPFTPAQQRGLGLTTTLADYPVTGSQKEATDIAESLAGGPLGESPATKASINAWEKIEKPKLRQDEAFRGQLYSGAGVEAEEQSLSDVTSKAIDREVANRARMVPELAGLGATEYSQALKSADQLSREGGTQFTQAESAAGDLFGAGTTTFKQMRDAYSDALSAAGMPRDVADRKADAVYKDYLRQQALDEALTLGVTGELLPSTFGQAGHTRSVSTGGGMFGKVVAWWFLPLALAAAIVSSVT